MAWCSCTSYRERSSENPSDGSSQASGVEFYKGESPVPGHEASGACLGIAPGAAARRKLCFTDQAAREVCKPLQPRKGTR